MQKADTCRKCKAAFVVIADPNGGEKAVLVALYCPNCGDRFTVDIPAGYNPDTVTIVGG
jgi:transcription elongation factor Elf1